ncbi:hypothetical protein VE03_10754 [Pseudogymnoascus sp. 23342-1-I1]|nr:hypothetical protein VE03_10754 [Pseudogymnoascus sp. 23342-1-I1]
MRRAKTYQRYKAAQSVLEGWLFSDLTLTSCVTDNFVEATLRKCDRCVPDKVLEALSVVIQGRELAMKHYGYLGHNSTFARHMHILQLFRWIRSTLENGGPSSLDPFKRRVTKDDAPTSVPTVPTDLDQRNT